MQNKIDITPGTSRYTEVAGTTGNKITSDFLNREFKAILNSHAESAGFSHEDFISGAFTELKEFPQTPHYNKIEVTEEARALFEQKFNGKIIAVEFTHPNKADGAINPGSVKKLCDVVTSSNKSFDQVVNEKNKEAITKSKEIKKFSLCLNLAYKLFQGLEDSRTEAGKKLQSKFNRKIIRKISTDDKNNAVRYINRMKVLLGTRIFLELKDIKPEVSIKPEVASSQAAAGSGQSRPGGGSRIAWA